MAQASRYPGEEITFHPGLRNNGDAINMYVNIVVENTLGPIFSATSESFLLEEGAQPTLTIHKFDPISVDTIPGLYDVRVDVHDVSTNEIIATNIFPEDLEILPLAPVIDIDITGISYT